MGHDDLVHSGHAHVRDAQRPHHPDLGRRLEAGPQDSCVDALVHRDTQVIGNTTRKRAQVGRIGVHHAHERRLDVTDAVPLDERISSGEVDLIGQDAKTHMGVSRHCARRAGKDDVTTAQMPGMTHEGCHLGRTVALVEMDASRIDHHRHLVDGANGQLEAVVAHGCRICGKSIDVMVVDAAYGPHELCQVPKPRSQDQGNGMLHRRLTGLDDILAHHTNPLLLEKAHEHAVSLDEPS